jgi:hypothetical protein
MIILSANIQAAGGFQGKPPENGIQFIRPIADFQTNSTSDSLLD